MQKYLTVRLECRHLKPLKDIPVYNIHRNPDGGYWAEIGCVPPENFSEADALLSKYKRKGVKAYIKTVLLE